VLPTDKFVVVVEISNCTDQTVKLRVIAVSLESVYCIAHQISVEQRCCSRHRHRMIISLPGAVRSIVMSTSVRLPVCSLA